MSSTLINITPLLSFSDFEYFLSFKRSVINCFSPCHAHLHCVMFSMYLLCTFLYLYALATYFVINMSCQQSFIGLNHTERENWSVKHGIYSDLQRWKAENQLKMLLHLQNNTYWFKSIGLCVTFLHVYCRNQGNKQPIGQDLRKWMIPSKCETICGWVHFISSQFWVEKELPKTFSSVWIPVWIQALLCRSTSFYLFFLPAFCFVFIFQLWEGWNSSTDNFKHQAGSAFLARMHTLGCILASVRG